MLAFDRANQVRALMSQRKTENQSTRIIAVIPAYNEELTIASVIVETRKHVDEVVVVDDGSRDGTAEIAKQSGAFVVSHRVNRGCGAAIRRGYDEALRIGADLIVQLDADGQYKPEEIPKLLEPLLSAQADVVLGSRLAGKIEYEMPLVKRLGNRAFTKLVRRLSGIHILTDAQTGFRAFRREVLEGLFIESSYTYTQEEILRLGRSDWRFIEVPVTFRSRMGGSSRLMANPLEYASKSFLIILKAMRDFHPFLFFGSIGGILLISGLVLGLDLLVTYFVTGNIPTGRIPTTVLVAVLLMIGVQLIFFGLIADIIAGLKKGNEAIVKRLKEKS